MQPTVLKNVTFQALTRGLHKQVLLRPFTSSIRFTPITPQGVTADTSNLSQLVSLELWAEQNRETILLKAQRCDWSISLTSSCRSGACIRRWCARRRWSWTSEGRGASGRSRPHPPRSWAGSPQWSLPLPLPSCSPLRGKGTQGTHSHQKKVGRLNLELTHVNIWKSASYKSRHREKQGKWQFICTQNSTFSRGKWPNLSARRDDHHRQANGIRGAPHGP